jgi:hypothetical protein
MHVRKSQKAHPNKKSGRFHLAWLPPAACDFQLSVTRWYIVKRPAISSVPRVTPSNIPVVPLQETIALLSPKTRFHSGDTTLATRTRMITLRLPTYRLRNLYLGHHTPMNRRTGLRKREHNSTPVPGRRILTPATFFRLCKVW